MQLFAGKLKKEVVLRMVKAMSRACQAQGCSLTGGETSEQPGVLVEDTYILTSSIVGIVEKSLSSTAVKLWWVTKFWLWNPAGSIPMAIRSLENSFKKIPA